MATKHKKIIKILRDEEQGRNLLPAVIEATNANRKALGFLPVGVYTDALASGRLWILSDDEKYCGHLFFGGARPRLHIKQLYVVESMRGQGLARKLVDELAIYGAQENYSSIRARVATDLEANNAWEKLGFEIGSSVSGGRTTGRTIYKRYRLLTPCGDQTHMFSIFDRCADDAITAVGMPINRAHWYTLDLNIWLDFALQREPFVDAARSIIEDASRGRFRLRFTGEAKSEVARTAEGRTQDPLMPVVMAWQAVAEENAPDLENLVERLRNLIFPERSLTGRRAANDASDLRHLALSIRAGSSGFVTREKAILKHRSEIIREFGLEVLSSSDLVEIREQSVAPLAPLGEGLMLDILERRWQDASIFVNKMLGKRARFRVLDREDEGLVCSLAGTMVGVLYWDRVHRADVEAFLVLDFAEDLDVDTRQRVLDILLGKLGADAHSSLPVYRILLRTDLDTCERYRQDFCRGGFFETSSRDLFVKFSSGEPLGFDQWSKARGIVERELDAESTWFGDSEKGPMLRLCSGPSVLDLDQFKFETFFGITALTLGKRRAYYIPIKEKFANDLLPFPWRPGMFQEHDASFRLERVYFRSPSAAVQLGKGDLIFFYVSAPICAVVGVARCTVSTVLPQEEACERFRRLAVLNPKEVGPQVHCIAFDNYIRFRNRLELSWLRQHRAIPSANFVSLSAVPSAVDPIQIIREGLTSENATDARF